MQPSAYPTIGTGLGCGDDQTKTRSAFYELSFFLIVGIEGIQLPAECRHTKIITPLSTAKI